MDLPYAWLMSKPLYRLSFLLKSNVIVPALTVPFQLSSYSNLVGFSLGCVPFLNGFILFIHDVSALAVVVNRASDVVIAIRKESDVYFINIWFMCLYDVSIVMVIQLILIVVIWVLVAVCVFFYCDAGGEVVSDLIF